MTTSSENARTVRHRLTTLTVIAGTMTVLSTAAMAGECPASKMGVDVTKPGATANKEATDKVLATIDLSKERVALADHQFRIRRLEIMPGGEIAWHSHADRPALIYVISGEMTEFASNCSVPIVHKTGEVAKETSQTSHWWKNTSNENALLLSADILHDQADPNM
jgi:quercetin dioxygenase-like cupin family protein